MSHNARIAVVTLLIAVTAVICALVLATPRAASPVRLATIKRWDSDNGSYVWLSARGGAIFQRNATASPTATSGRFVVSPFGGYPDAAGLTHDLELTTRQIRMPCPRLSPDGQRVAWIGTRGDWRLGWYVADVTGSRLRYAEGSNVDSARVYPPIWLPDSRHFDSVEGRSFGFDVYTYSVSSGRALKRHYETSEPVGVGAGITRSGRVISVEPSVFEITGPGLLKSESAAVGIISFDAPPAAPVAAVTIAATPSYFHDDLSAVLSPDGRHIAWSFRESPPMCGIEPFGGVGLARYWPHRSAVSSVWLSAPNGTGFRRVAEVSGAKRNVDQLAWRPDGKAVSYVYDNILWEVATE